MLHQGISARRVVLLASVAACLGLAACGGDDAADANGAVDPVSGDTSPDTTVAGETTAPAGDADEVPAAAADGETTSSGTVTVDGVTYTFSPSICLPDEAAGSAINGPGSAPDGTAVYVDMAAGNLSIYVGTEDPFAGDPDYVANGLAGQGSLEETVDGSTISVEASFTAPSALEVIAAGSLSVTC